MATMAAERPLLTHGVVHIVLALMLVLICAACGAPAMAPSEHATAPARQMVRARDGDGVLDAKDEAPPAPPVAEPTPAKARTEPEGTEKPPLPSTAADARETQLIIYTARITVAVYQVDQGVASVERIARDMGGYLSLKRDREITVRVPRDRFQPALAAIDKIGDILHRDIQAEDVTDAYVDTEIRIKNAKAMQVRLRQLLERAAVKEALDIEKELARVTQELELLEGRLKLLKDKIAFSTITVTFEPRGSTIQAARVRLPFPWLAGLGLPSLLSLEETK